MGDECVKCGKCVMERVICSPCVGVKIIELKHDNDRLREALKKIKIEIEAMQNLLNVDKEPGVVSTGQYPW